jgi:Reverse transcriptase (RNA-dependent DNA polymerase)
MEDGSIIARMARTPQGGVISPLLANLFLHYAFDMWMAREFPHVPFERYADDAICHCLTESEARALWQALAPRLADCLQLCPPLNLRGREVPIPVVHRALTASIRLQIVLGGLLLRISPVAGQIPASRLTVLWCTTENRWRSRGTSPRRPGASRSPRVAQ